MYAHIHTKDTQKKTTRNNGNTGKKYSLTEDVLLTFSHIAFFIEFNFQTIFPCSIDQLS